MSQCQNKNSKKGLFGTNWTSTLYFVNEPQKQNYKLAQKTISDDALEERMNELLQLVGPNQKIVKVFRYKTNLSKLQITSLIFNHQYVLIQTNEWWWTVEKDSSCIKMQRSKLLSEVAFKWQREDRISYPQLLQEIQSNCHLSELFQYFKQSRILQKKYHIFTRNCQGFACQIMSRLAQPSKIIKIAQST